MAERFSFTVVATGESTADQLREKLLRVEGVSEADVSRQQGRVVLTVEGLAREALEQRQQERRETATARLAQHGVSVLNIARHF